MYQCWPLRVTIAVGMLQAVLPEEFLSAWSSVLWRGFWSASLAGALLWALEQWSILSACDSLPPVTKSITGWRSPEVHAGSGRSQVPGRMEGPSGAS